MGELGGAVRETSEPPTGGAPARVHRRPHQNPPGCLDAGDAAGPSGFGIRFASDLTEATRARALAEREGPVRPPEQIGRI